MSTICCVKVDMLSIIRIASFFMAASFASSGGIVTGNVTSGRLSGPPPPPRCANSEAGRASETPSRLAQAMPASCDMNSESREQNCAAERARP
jgi:hypothetical protein